MINPATTIELYNNNRIQTAVYAADRDSVMIQPRSKVTVNAKFKWQIPPGVKLVRDIKPSTKKFS